jgi:TRAP-type uncharacterized transport system substrate-binding protein
VTLAALLVAWPSAAQEAPRYEVIASGERGRTYHDHYARNLMSQLRAFRIRNRETTGSGENLDLLADGKADIAFAQADIYAARLRASRERYARLTVIGRLTDECVYIAYRVAGPVASFAALGGTVDGRKPKIAVGPTGGGMSGTWSFMASLEPRLASAEVVNTGGTLALNQLSIGMYDAVGWVTDPRNLDHVLLRAVQANAELDLLAIEAPKLEYALADGTVIYESRAVDAKTADDPQQLRTLCTGAMIIARPDANPRFVEAVSEVLSFQREKILRVN